MFCLEVIQGTKICARIETRSHQYVLLRPGAYRIRLIASEGLPDCIARVSIDCHPLRGTYHIGPGGSHDVKGWKSAIGTTEPFLFCPSPQHFSLSSVDELEASTGTIQAVFFPAVRESEFVAPVRTSFGATMAPPKWHISSETPLFVATLRYGEISVLGRVLGVPHLAEPRKIEGASEVPGLCRVCQGVASADRERLVEEVILWRQRYRELYETVREQQQRVLLNHGEAAPPPVHNLVIAQTGQKQPPWRPSSSSPTAAKGVVTGGGKAMITR